MRRHPGTKQSRQMPRCEQCDFTLTHKNGMRGQRSYRDTCRQGDIWSSHEEDNEGVEQFRLRGPSPKKPKALQPALFTLGAEHQLYANLFLQGSGGLTEQRACWLTLRKPEISILPLADVFFSVRALRFCVGQVFLMTSPGHCTRGLYTNKNNTCDYFK